MNDYLKESGYQPALRLERIFPIVFLGFATKIFGVVALCFLVLSVYFLSGFYFSWTLILLGLFLPILALRLFAGYLQGDHPPITFSAANLLMKSAQKDSLRLREFLLALSDEPGFLWVLRRLRITRANFRTKIAETYHDDGLPLAEVAEAALRKATACNHLEIRYADLLVAVYELDKKFQDLLFTFQVQKNDVLEVAYWQRRIEERRRRASRFWEAENLLDIQGIGKTWSGGYTINLDLLTVDVTRRVKRLGKDKPLYGRWHQVELLSRMLIRGAGASNAVLVGQPGVGRHTVVESFAHSMNNGLTFGPLRYMRLLEIDAASVVAGAANENEVVQRINLLFGEAALARNVILLVNDIDAFFDSHGGAGRVNATEALLPFLQSGLRIIGTTTVQGYETTIGKNPQLARLISKLEISETSPTETLLVLEDEVLAVERRLGLFFSFAALKEIVSLATKLILNLPNPEKSLEVLGETGVYTATQAHEHVVLPEHVQAVVTARTKVPAGKVGGKEKELLLNLEELLHERIIGQDEAIHELADALRRARAGVRSEQRPIGSFLFLGPTGVGKTETTKALAAVYFGDEKRMIRFDMSEFAEAHSINRLIGDTDSGQGGLLTEAVIENPFGVILLDELEKAHPKVLDLLLQVLDEGSLTDAMGRKISFVNTVIVATSNAGAEMIRQMVKTGASPAAVREPLLNELMKLGQFRPEFLNRFDGVIIFRPLSDVELQQVATLLLHELNARLKEKEIQVEITPDLAAAVVRGGWHPEFGARPLRRYIQEHIENYVAFGLLSGEIRRGETVKIPPETLDK